MRFDSRLPRPPCAGGAAACAAGRAFCVRTTVPNAANTSAAIAPMTANQTGLAGHVHEMEAWRRDAGAREAFLVSMAGFAPGAVRAAKEKPITLVEAHLLAGWAATAEGTEQPR